MNLFKELTWKTLLPFIGIALPVLALDLVSKWLIRLHIPHGFGYPVIPGFFNLRHDRNSGAAFGVLAGQRTFLILVTFVAFVFIFVYFLKFRNSRWMQIASGFLLGGAIGNFIDRIRSGQVVDFLQFGIESQGLFWPTFNVADVSVCIGAGMLIVYLFRNRHRHDANL